ncbi:helix-turn-helix domain-containing protein [Brevundimonas diminuta]|uniref:helix-turn-helix domain-containing protein n=1 Tax=Brevundimonas diminuta TaxID=293 RepID=UPI0032079318
MMDGATFSPAANTANTVDAKEPKRLNRRQAAKARTRQRVFDSAETLFNDVGFERATIRAIAKGAGMSTGAVFANFEDKTALYVAVFGHPPLTPEQGRELVVALRRSHDMLEAFADEEGVPELLTSIKAALPPLPVKAAADA